MSEHYPAGDMDPYIRTALDKAAIVREIYRRVANVQHPDAWHPLRDLPELRPDRDDDRHRLGWRAGLLRVPGALVTWARGCGQSGWTRRSGAGEAAVEPGVGGAMVALRRHDRAVRQGPLDGRRVARPLRRDRPRGLRARAAAQRSVRVPEHRRQEDVDLQGARRSGPRDRGCRSNRSSFDSCSSARSRTTPSTSTPRARTRSRASSTSSTASRTPRPASEVKRRDAPGFESTFRYSLLDPAADVRPRRPGSGRPSRHLALLLQVPNVDVAERVGAEKGSRLDEREQRILDERIDAARGWLAVYAPDKRQDRGPAGRAARGGGGSR